MKIAFLLRVCSILLLSGFSLANAASKGQLVGTLKVTAASRTVAAPVSSGKTDEYGYPVQVTPTPTGHTAPEEVVIYLEKVPGHYKAPKKHVKLDQKYLHFSHRVLAVLKGTTIDFTNSDPVYHNIFTNSQKNPFDLGRKNSGQVASVKMKKVEVPVKVYCEIHSQMKTNILVLQNPFFATVKPGESFKIDGVPPGTYNLIAWHDYWEPVQQTVTVKKGKPTEVDITMDKVRN